jgi:hypothetical protein
MPARTSSASRSGLDVAGPSVQTILARRRGTAGAGEGVRLMRTSAGRGGYNVNRLVDAQRAMLPQPNAGYRVPYAHHRNGGEPVPTWLETGPRGLAGCAVAWTSS